MPAWLDGLLGGINQASDVNRAERLRKEEDADRFERAELSRIAGDESYTTEVRERAATGLLALASGQKRPRGGFFSRLLGVDPIQAHPAVSQIYSFMRGSEEKGAGLPSGPVATARRMPTAPPSTTPSTPGAAAQPAQAATQPGGGPASTAQLPSPAGQPPPRLAMGDLGVDPTTGAPPQGPPLPGVMQPRQILRSPQEIETERFMAREYGEIQGTVKGLMAVGVPEADARAVAIAERMRRGIGATGSIQSIAGVMPDGTRRFGILDRRPGSPTMARFVDPDTGQPLIGFRPAATGSVSMATDREAIASANFGGRSYAQLTPAEQQRVLTLEREMIGGEAYTRTMQGNLADAAAPLSTQAARGIEAGMRDDLRIHTQNAETMVQQYGMMKTALDRFLAGERVASVDAIRATFGKIVDPQSVVREAEYNRQGLGLSTFQTLEGLYQKYVKGGGAIPDSVIVELVETARQFTVQAQQRAEVIRQRFRDTAIRSGVNPDNVLMSLGAGGPPPQSMGTINAPPPPPPGAGQGGGGAAVGAPPPIPAAPPPGAPTVGGAVGNPVPPGARTGTAPDGTRVADIPGIGVVPIRQINGAWYW